MATTRQRWRQHLWRCVLELQIRAARTGEEESELAHGWMPRDGNVGPTPAHVASFEAYAAVALERLGLPAADPAALAALWQANAHHERRLAAFVALRGVLAPVVERLLLLDRALYVHEAAGGGVRVALLPLFSPVDSPRNTDRAARARRIAVLTVLTISLKHQFAYPYGQRPVGRISVGWGSYYRVTVNLAFEPRCVRERPHLALASPKHSPSLSRTICTRTLSAAPPRRRT